jgi:hypothetical protein
MQVLLLQCFQICAVFCCLLNNNFEHAGSGTSFSQPRLAFKPSFATAALPGKGATQGVLADLELGKVAGFAPACNGVIQVMLPKLSDTGLFVCRMKQKTMISDVGGRIGTFNW